MNLFTRRISTSKNLRSHFFYRKTIQKNSARLRTRKTQQFPMNRDSAYAKSANVAPQNCRRSSSTEGQNISASWLMSTFDQTCSPNSNKRLLQRIRRDFQLSKLANIEQNNLTTSHRSSEGCLLLPYIFPCYARGAVKKTTLRVKRMNGYNSFSISIFQ